MLKQSTVSARNHAAPPRNGYAAARVAILSGILFLSGIGALIFETLWLRLSGLAFGNSVWSAALILSSFMAGLALGNALAASSRIRRWRPLHLYAVLGEAYLVGAFGLRGTSVAAGLAVFTAAAIALLVARYEGDTAAFIPGKIIPLRLGVRYRPPWRLLFVSFGTGCILLALEVIWFRFLRLYVASSATAFAIMLAVVLAGIGLGGVVSGAIHRRRVAGDARASHSEAATGRSGSLPVLLLLAAITTLR